MASSDPSDISPLGKIAEYTEILAKDPGSTIFVALADAYRRLGMTDEALEVAQEGVNNLPRYAPGYLILGRIHYERKDLDRAAVALESAYALDPGGVIALQGLVRVLLGKGDKVRVRLLLEEGIQRHPDNAVLRQLLSSLGPPSAAASARVPITAPADRPEDDPIATPTIAEIYLKQGLPQRALKVYRDLLQANPRDEGVRRKIDLLENALATDAGAQQAATQAVESTTSASPLMSLRDRHLELLDRWLTAVRERKTHVP
jgi:tetratricopeptide (TPR) repeat protein